MLTKIKLKRLSSINLNAAIRGALLFYSMSNVLILSHASLQFNGQNSPLIMGLLWVQVLLGSLQFTLNLQGRAAWSARQAHNLKVIGSNPISVIFRLNNIMVMWKIANLYMMVQVRLQPIITSKVNHKELYAKVTQWVECNLAKVKVESSSLFFRWSIFI